MREDALELETRQRIFQHVKKVPGAHMREIGREVGIPMGTLEYHLHYLVKAGVLVTREDGRYVRYFASDEGGRRERDVLACIRQETPRRITVHLLYHPGSTHGAILQNFQMSASTLSFHLKKLVTGTILRQEKEGRENRYWVIEPDLVARVLITYRKSFLDDVVDRFADVWSGLAATDDPQ
ncbi:MAG TPA: transcriptional regulator [Candidatus Thermoplasmatota archaeon]|nr:transcriptional regulator [Candidatus Thermoplasmatota archaeon]